MPASPAVSTATFCRACRSLSARPDAAAATFSVPSVSDTTTLIPSDDDKTSASNLNTGAAFRAAGASTGACGSTVSAGKGTAGAFEVARTWPAGGGAPGEGAVAEDREG